MHRSGLTELEVVMAVVRRGSFRAAAQELGMSATAVSNAIAGLESRLDTRLFNRTTRSVALTDAGQRYVARIGPALQEIRLASEEIHSDTGEPAGTLRLNVPNHIGSLFLDQLLIDFVGTIDGVEFAGGKAESAEQHTQHGGCNRQHTEQPVCALLIAHAQRHGDQRTAARADHKAEAAQHLKIRVDEVQRRKRRFTRIVRDKEAVHNRVDRREDHHDNGRRREFQQPPRGKVVGQLDLV